MKHILKFIKDFFTRNILLKLLAVVLAVIVVILINV